MTKLTHFDIIIIGAGPAGCSAAINMQSKYQVAVIEQHLEAVEKIGESLPPACKRLFETMGIWDDFLQENHLACYGNRASWASDTLEETDFIRDIDGNGWHVDRAAFENWLRDQAQQRQATLYKGEKFVHAQYESDKWIVQIQKGNEKQTLSASLIIDASGRQGSFTRQQVGKKRYDNMICSWIKGDEVSSQEDAGFSLIQAAENGWWYSASVPGNQRILSFHTDSRLDILKDFSDSQKQLNAAKQHPHLAKLLERTQFNKANSQGKAPAHSSRIEQFSDITWLAVGDAAMSMDPISSQGMFNGLYTGMIAAQSIHREKSKVIFDFKHYNETLEKIWQTYQDHLGYWYSTASDNLNSKFWQLKATEYS